MKKQIVLGTFFGDEGKGSTVQWLCNEAINRGEKPVVVRFSGGPQAGHRIVYNGIEHVCSSFGSGVLLGVETILNENVYVNPFSIKTECEVLQRKGVTPNITISFDCRCITPYDQFSNLKDSNNLNNGSCGMGIYQTFKRCKDTPKYSTIRQAIADPEGFLKSSREYHGFEKDEPYESLFLESIEWLLENATFYDDTVIFNNYDTIIYEGSQGLLLDMDCGFMPNCTPSKVGLNGLSEEVLQDAEVFFVMRPYLTRHGNGYVPEYEKLIKERFTLEEPSNLDTGIQGKFKVGILDLDLLRTIRDRHHLDNYSFNYNLKYNFVLTHVDCIVDLNQFPVYELNLINPVTNVSLDDLSKSIRLRIKYSNFYISLNQELSNNQFKLYAKF